MWLLQTTGDNLPKKPKTESTKPSSLDRVAEIINTKYGARTIIEGNKAMKTVPRLQTGVFIFTYIAGGGYPWWRITRIKGPEGGGKSTVAMDAMKMVAMTCWRCGNIKEYCTCSKSTINGKTIFLDVEGTFDREWAKSIGVPIDSYVLVNASDGGEFLDILETALRADDCMLGVIDSIAQLLPPVETDREVGDKKVASQPQFVRDGCMKLQARMNSELRRRHPCLILAINQISYKIGIMQGNPETEPAGQAFKHWSALRIRMNKLLTESDKLKKYADEERSFRRLQKHGIRIDGNKVWIVEEEAEFHRAREDLYEGSTLVCKKGRPFDIKETLKYLQRYGLFAKEKGGYVLTFGDTKEHNMKVKTQEELKETFLTNEPLYFQTHKALAEEVRRQVVKEEEET